MHLLKTATVNASFLSYRALSTIITIRTKELHTTSTRSSTSRHPVRETTTSDAHIQQSLPDFLRYAPHISFSNGLTATRARFTLTRPLLDAAFASTVSHQPASMQAQQATSYPWTPLAAFAPDKTFSDLIESTLAAVWIDTRGSFSACEKLLRHFGILTWLEAALQQGLAKGSGQDGLNVWHPKEEIGALVGQMGGGVSVGRGGSKENAGQPASGVRYIVSATNDTTIDGMEDDAHAAELVYGKGKMMCKLMVGEEELAVASGWSRIEVETRAAEMAIAVLKERLRGPKDGTATNQDEKTLDVMAPALVPWAYGLFPIKEDGEAGQKGDQVDGEDEEEDDRAGRLETDYENIFAEEGDDDELLLSPHRSMIGTKRKGAFGEDTDWI